MKLVFADKSSADQSDLSVTTERLVNFYPASGAAGGRAQITLRSVPGLADHATVPGPFLRRLCAADGKLYALAAGALVEVGQGGTATHLASIADDETATMAGHRGALTIVSDGAYLVYQDGDVTQPAGGRITPGSVAFLDQHTMLGDADGRELEWTEVGDPLDMNALNFATAEADDDKVVRIIRFNAYLAVMKAETTEIWANTGLGGFNAFARVSGAVWRRGLLAFNLVTEIPVGLFFVGDDRVAYVAMGGEPAPVSNAAVDEALKNGKPTHCFYYEDRGHRFCVIRFADRPAWVYDASTGMWHERATGVDHAPWDIICSAFCYGKWFLGSQTGRVYTLQSLPVDGGQPMRRMAVSRPLYMDGERFCVAQLEFSGRFGRNSVDEIAPDWITDQYGMLVLDDNDEPLISTVQHTIQQHKRPARMWIRISRDSNTYGPPKVRNIGRIGGYEATCRYKALGQFRQMVVEMNITDPVDVPLHAECNVAVS